MRDGIGVDGARLDYLKKSLSSSKPGGIEVVLTSHAHMKPRLSCYYDSSGGIVEVKSKIDTLRLSHDPMASLQESGSNLLDSVCGSVFDPNLQQISCSPEFGQHVKLVLDRMPQQGSHSFVGLCQLETAFARDTMQKKAFNFICTQPNFPRGGHGHEHDGFSCLFGQHHSCRKFVGPYATRPGGRLDDQVSI
jgi:hypothetical protein